MTGVQTCALPIYQLLRDIDAVSMSHSLEVRVPFLDPLLADKPWAHSLNLTVGTRYSDYSSAGNTTNSKVALEWRPIENLLLRGTVSQVFRAPNINELYAGIGGDSPTVSDPCNFYTGTQKSVDNMGGRVEKFRNRFGKTAAATK